MNDEIPPLERLFDSFEATALGTAVRESIYAFPLIEAVHLLGLCMLGGALLVVDLRMLGLGMTDRRISELARSARPWLLTGIAILIVTGIPLFLSEAIKAYFNASFWVKMTTLPFALAFTLLVRERVARNDEIETGTLSRVVGAVSIALWFVVAAAGRWIGYS